MITSYEVYIRHFLLSYVLFFNAFLAFCKTQNIKLSKKRTIISFLINVVFSIIYSVLYTMEYCAIAQIFSYTTAIVSLSFLLTKRGNILISLISTCYAHILKIGSIFISSIIMFFIFGSVFNLLPYILACIISIILNVLLLKIKRLKNGILFFEKTENLGLGLIISGVIVLLSVIEYNGATNIFVIIIAAFSVLLCGFGIFLWIKKGITKHYREKQQLKSDTHYKEMLEKKEAEIEQLNRSNNFLSKVVHRDNHLMSSLSVAINTYKRTKSDDDKEKLLDEMQTLINERGELIQTELKESKLFSSTGNSLIDSAINDLYIKAAAHGIDFDISVSATVDEVIGKYISQTDLQTLICDHIKDAIIAVDAKNENNGKILVEFSKNNDNYTITIFDSGVDFEIDTLAKLGKERVTTHADNGGSGIGFMTTFETLRKSYATLIITEFENKTPFSKSVSIRFDGNTTFIIQSYRKEELQSALNRDDIILL